MSLPNWASLPEERTLLEGETLNRGVRRVADAWCARDSDTTTSFSAELKRRFPEELGSLSDESLATLCSLVWMYIGGTGSVNEGRFFNWWNDALGA